MAGSIGKIYHETRNAGLRDHWHNVPSHTRKATEEGAKAVAIHVLEIARPRSQILAAMKEGKTFEDAVEFAATERDDAESADWYREALMRIATGADPVETSLSYLGHNSVDEIIEQSGG